MADKKSKRDKRLAAALRENLKRRKAQAREVDAEKPEPPREPPQSRSG